MFSCAGQPHFKAAVKYSTCFSSGTNVELRGKDAVERYKNRRTKKKTYLHMMSIESPLNTAAFLNFSFFFFSKDRARKMTHH